MSRTDKTDPWWLKLSRKEWHAQEEHTHHGPRFTGVCEVIAPLPPTRGKRHHACEVWQSYYNSPFGDKIWGRHPKGKQRRLCGNDGRARSTLRRLKHKWATVDREDIDSFEAAPYQRWLWAKWYWD